MTWVKMKRLHKLKEKFYCQINLWFMIILPNVIFAVNPLPTPLLLEINLINIWFLKDFNGDGAEFPDREIIDSSLSLPPSYNSK